MHKKFGFYVEVDLRWWQQLMTRSITLTPRRRYSKPAVTSQECRVLFDFWDFAILIHFSAQLDKTKMDHHHPTGDDLDHELTVVKIVAAIVLGLGSFILGVAPLKTTVDKWRAATENQPQPEWSSSCGQPRRLNHSRLVDPVAYGMRGAASLLLCFGGGALLSATLLLVAPEARDAADALRHDGRLPRDVERLADALMCAGFFAALLADRAALFDRYRSLRGRGDDDVEMQRSRGGPEPTAAGREDRSVTSTGMVAEVLALFEGMAVGLERSADSAWCLFAAVAAHRLAAAFRACLEPTLSGRARGPVPPMQIVRAAASATIAPVGVAFGAAFARHCSAADGSPGPAAVVLHCLAAGALLYVVFFEVLPRHRRSGWSSYLTAAVFGFTVLSLLQETSECILYLSYPLAT